MLQNERDFSRFTRFITFRPFFQQVVQTPGKALLDVGCGVGRFCQAAYSQGWNVTGIDISNTAIEIGQRYAAFPMRAANLAEIAAEPVRFDVVTAFEVMEHLTQPVSFLSQIRDVLGPSGEVFCTVPHWDCEGVRSATRPDWVPPIHLLFFTQAALRTLAERAGFRDITVGLIWTDPLPDGFVDKLRWVKRRLKGEPREPSGLWLHAFSQSREG